MSRELNRLLDLQGTTELEVERLLSPIRFSDWRTAHQRLLGLCRDEASREALSASLPMLLNALQSAATPDNSVLNFERLVQSVPDGLGLLRFLGENPRAVEILVKLFVGSQFLTEILLRNPEYLRELTWHKRIAEFKSREDFFSEAMQSMRPCETIAEKADALRRFQHWELLRIGACDNFGLMDFKSVTLQLSLLADSIVQSALAMLSSELQVPSDEFAVLGFGKLGGEELNYSSDIDLVFICQRDAGRFWDLGQRLIRVLMDATAEGFLYRVDMRLRPWGRSGALVSTVDAYVDYLQKHGQLWEKQALLKARPIAGNLRMGYDFLRQIESIIFSASAEAYRESVRVMKQKIEAELAKKGRMFGEVKSGQGSIRDIEFVTQFLQLKHGRSQKAVRSANTLDGLVRLADFDCILPGEYRRLSAAYVLFRTIEHALQLMHYKQVHSLPTEERELSYLARRLDFPGASAFLNSYQQYCIDIRTIYDRYIEHAEPEADQASTDDGPRLPRHAEVMEPSYAKVFSAEEIQRHAVLLERLNRDNPIEVEAAAAPGGRVQLTVCGFDQKGDLAMMCGLLFACGFDIVNGNVFTAEQVLASREPTRISSGRSTTEAKKFVDVFILKPPNDAEALSVWPQYRSDLTALVKLAAEGQLREAQGELAKRVAAGFRDVTVSETALLPIEIDLNNEQTDRFTVLHISAEDTPGFLYELTNALSLVGFDIHRVIVGSLGNRVVDTLFIAGPNGGKVTEPKEQTRLRAAIVLIKHFTHLLPRSPNPDNALLHFGQFIEQLFERPAWVDELASLDRSEVLEALAQLLGVSDFLWEDFLRLQHDNLFPVVRDVESLKRRKSKSELEAELAAELATAADASEQQRRLNAFKDREMFRVDMRHIVGQVPEFGDFSAELTEVAEVVVSSAYELCHRYLEDRYGRPQLMLPSGERTANGMSVLALGKAGGRELGFASDIELMFIYSGQGQTTGRELIGSSEFYVKLVEDFTHTIEARRKGIFEIDLRLRPFGNAGPLAVSLEAFENYFNPSGAAWPFERQALVKLRPIGGDPRLGEQVIALRDRLVYTGQPFDRAAMRAMRERQLRQLVKPGTLNAKLSAGGLVDCEYLVQGLQITFGHAYPQLRATNTVDAMTALHATTILSDDEFQSLSAAYGFLRRLIDALRMVRGDARDLTVPDPKSDEFIYLARRLGYGAKLGQLKSDIDQTAADVIGLSRLLDEKIR